MLFYIAFIAIVNLMLGYALAVYTGAARGRVMVVARPERQTPDPYASDGNYDSADAYDSAPSAAIAQAEDHQDDEAPAAGQESAMQTEETPLIDAASGLKTRSHFQQLLRWRGAAADAAETHLTVALLEIDRPSELDQSVEDRLLRGVANTVRQLITDSQTAVRYSDHQFLLLLDNDESDKASERAEHVRQWIEATEYVADGDPLHATVTGALLETTAAEPEARLLEQLQQALEEARRCGGNCTFKHDGLAVSPVPPLALNLEPQKCSI